MKAEPLPFHGPGWRIERPQPRPLGLDEAGEEFPTHDDHGVRIDYYDSFIVWAPRPEKYQDIGGTVLSGRGREGWAANWQAADGLSGHHVEAPSLDEALTCFDTYPNQTVAQRVRALFRHAAAELEN